MPVAPAATPSYLSASIGSLESRGSSFEAPSLFPTLLNIALSLAFVVTLIYVINWLLRRWKAGRGERQAGDPANAGIVTVLEKTWLDNKRGLAVVEMGGEALLLGLGENVTLLAKVSDEAAVAKIREAAPSPGGLLNFQEQLERVGLQLRRQEWKRSKASLKSDADAIGEQIAKLKPSKKKENPE